MSTQEVVRDEQQIPARVVPLLYMCDFPPSNLGGGPILMSRLLREYPPDQLTVLTSTRYTRISPEDGRLSCEEIAVALSPAHGRLGLGRLRVLLNWLRIPQIAITATRTIRRRRIEAVVTLLHGRFYLAAAVAARLSRIPYVLIVHDDYAKAMSFITRWLTAAVMRNAAYLYSVSPGMQDALRVQFGVESELQRPATERPRFQSPRAQNDELSIVFAGSITGAVEDSLRMLANVITSGRLRQKGIERAKLRLYTVFTEQQKRDWGWYHPDIVIHPWVGQSELAEVLRQADILFLPFSFSPSERHTVVTAFPSKTADYLVSGTPILILGPEYSSLAVYAAQEGFAEILTKPDADLLALAIRRIALDAHRREELRARASHVFATYHDIVQQRTQFSRMLSLVANRRGT
jgi:glycosyltransferase involved in cell wall biosynthesis